MKMGEIITTPFFEYEIQESLGEGGAGLVFKVQRVDDKNVFAVKILKVPKESLTGDKFKRFKNEFAFLLTHSHPNIIRAIDSGLTEDGRHFYVMPLASSTFREWIKNKNSEDAWVDIFVKLLEGIIYLHDREIIHRDIKPENILIIEENPVVADLGIAHFEEYNISNVETSKSDRLANFPYAAPEQRMRQTCSTLTDVYALGLILNEMFTGNIPTGSNYQKISNSRFEYLNEIIRQSISQNAPDRPTAKEMYERIKSENKDKFKIQINDIRDTAIHFAYDRMARAFPDAPKDELKEYTDLPDIIRRLDVLFKSPLKLGAYTPIWYSRGSQALWVSDYYSVKEKNIVYIGGYECIISKIVASPSVSDFRSFVYLEFIPQQSIKYSKEEIERDGFATSEFIATYDAYDLNYSEVSAGFFWRNEECISIEKEKLNCFDRWITPSNLIITSHCSFFIKERNTREIDEIMNGILCDTHSVLDLKKYINSKPNPHPDC